MTQLLAELAPWSTVGGALVVVVAAVVWASVVAAPMPAAIAATSLVTVVTTTMGASTPARRSIGRRLPNVRTLEKIEARLEAHQLTVELLRGDLFDPGRENQDDSVVLEVEAGEDVGDGLLVGEGRTGEGDLI